MWFCSYYEILEVVTLKGVAVLVFLQCCICGCSYDVLDVLMLKVFRSVRLWMF